MCTAAAGSGRPARLEGRPRATICRAVVGDVASRIRAVVALIDAADGLWVEM